MSPRSFLQIHTIRGLTLSLAATLQLPLATERLAASKVPPEVEADNYNYDDLLLLLLLLLLPRRLLLLLLLLLLGSRILTANPKMLNPGSMGLPVPNAKGPPGRSKTTYSRTGLQLISTVLRVLGI